MVERNIAGDLDQMPDLKVSCAASMACRTSRGDAEVTLEIRKQVGVIIA